MIFSPEYMILAVFLMIVMGLASKNVQSTFKRYGKVPIRSRMTGAQAARYILDANGLQSVPVERVAGNLTDHYDSRSKVLRLSEPVYDNASISAVGVAAHEAGHALQDKSGYFALQMRQGLIPFANFGSNFGMILIFIGAIGMYILPPIGLLAAIAGLALYALGVLATIVTLPVEFNASSRALAQINQYGLVSTEEHAGARKVLNAAALTYVAAALGAILTLLYYVWIIFGNRD